MEFQKQKFGTEFNKQAVEMENEALGAWKEEIEQRGVSIAFLVILITVSIVTIVYGSVYIHESEASVDNTVNWPLFWMAMALQQCIIAGLMLATYRFASRECVKKGGSWVCQDRRMGKVKYGVVVGFLVLCSYLVQTGVYNAIATPNVDYWNSIGLIFGSVLVGIGSLIAIGVIAYFVYRSNLKQKKEKEKKNQNQKDEAIEMQAIVQKKER